MDEVADLLFSLLISYVGALEFMYVMRHLYHWSFRHDLIADRNETSSEQTLQDLQDRLRSQLSVANENEQRSGYNAMQDGVLYRDGFRIDPNSESVSQMKNDPDPRLERRKEIEAELERQMKIEEETRQQLELAELALAEERAKMEQEALENERKLMELEKIKEEEQKLQEIAQLQAEAEEEAENERRLLELEKAREEEQRLQEIALLQAEEEEENEMIMLELENARQEFALLQAEEEKEEHERKILELKSACQEIARIQAQEEAENQRKLLELENAIQEEQRLQDITQMEREKEALQEEEEEEEEEDETLRNERKLLEHENAVQEEQKLQEIIQIQAAEAENERKLLELEKLKELEQRLIEMEREQDQEEEEEQEQEQVQEEEHFENENKIFEAEKSLEEEQKNLEIQEEIEDEQYLRQLKEEEDALEFARQLIAEDKMFEDSEKSDREISPDSISEEISEKDFIKKNLKTEEMSPESKQKMIEENAQKFLKAEQEMVNLLEAEKLPSEEPLIQKVKTQFGQTGNESYSVSSKSLLFPSLSDEGSSLEPKSSQQSSFSTQPSEEVTTTGPEDTARQFPETERQDPEGEDNIPDIQFSDEYLRSLDGIKHRPIIREDGSGRRRAFKKRRSSGSSNSSRDSKASRDEELKMFTSLEEEEMRKTDTDYAPIKYTSEPNLKVKAHHRRHKRSPAKDCKVLDESLKDSSEVLGEEAINPWGEVVHEPYKHTEFWKREKAMSIDEEEIEIDLSSVSPDLRNKDDGLEETEQESELESSRLKHKTSSFEDATKEQNEEAAITLQNQQKSNEASEQTIEESNTLTAQTTPSDNDNNKKLQASQDTEEILRSARFSPGLRRSPRIGDHMDEYEDNFELIKSPSPVTSPIISVQEPTDDDSWIDEHGLLIQGLSDFYDFTASTNPSRSRSTSRAPSPPIPSKMDEFKFPKNDDQSLGKSNEPSQDPNETIRTKLPLNVSKESSEIQIESISSPSISIEEPMEERIIDQHGSLLQGISDFYDFTGTLNQSRSRPVSRATSPSPKNVNFSSTEGEILNLEFLENYQEASASSAIPINELDVYDDTESMGDRSPNFQDITNLIESSSLEEASSLSKNLRMVADKPEKSMGRSEIVPLVFVNDNNPIEDERDSVIDNFNIQRSNSRSGSEKSSRSRSTSPLPTDSNLAKSIQNRKEKRIQYDEQIYEMLQSSSTESSHQESISEKFSKNSCTQSSQSSKDEMNSLIESLRIERVRSHSRSKSPLPSALNLEKSLEARRHKRIQKNDELFEKIERELSSNALPTQDEASFLPESLRFEERRSRSRSRSPLGSARIREEKIELRQTEIFKQREEHIEEMRREEMTSLIESLRAERVRSSRSRTPLPPSNTESFEQAIGNETNSHFIESLRTERGRSKSPLPTSENFEMNIETRISEKNFESSQSYENKNKIFTETPIILIENADSMTSEKSQKSLSPEEDMSSFIATLRSHRSRSRSKSPMRLPSAANLDNSLDSRRKKLIERNDLLKEQLDERAKTPEPPRVTVEYVFEVEEEKSEAITTNQHRDRQSRSRSPSRSPPPLSELLENDSQSPSASSTPLGENSKGSSSSNLSSLDNLSDYLDFHLMLNLEASMNRTLVKTTEELESCLASKQIEIDSEALEKFKTANEEIELRTVSPSHIQTEAERLRKLKCTPTTPDYNRTISEEWLDSQRIKEDILQRGFKRSTYVGESMDLGAEYEPLRREAAFFKRSRTPSPSIHIIDDDIEMSRRKAAEARQVQAEILSELSQSSVAEKASENKHGAIPKTDPSRFSIQSSDSVQINLEDLRQQTAEFRRSRSKSRSPFEIPNFTDNVREDIIDEVHNNSQRFKEFSRNLNVDFLESERRASDSALIQKPDQHQEIEDLEPEEYHHYRRFSLAQEQPIEVYPDDDFVYVSQIEVRTPKGTRTWLQEDYYSEQLESLNAQFSEVLGVLEESARENENDWLRNEDESNGSEDERQTVVEVEDEIEEDLADYNERGTTDESHHEISECEEADREQDRFAGRGAQDWQNVHNDFFAYGFENDPVPERLPTAPSQPQTLAYDSDSFAIDQIYEEAIKNRKQSGIMRDYDCILKEISNGFLEKSSQLSSADSDSDRERYALWAKTRALEKANHIELARSFLDKERENKDNEIRYLGDAEATTRQSVRLRSRYGYLPLLSGTIDDLEVDLNYKPKKEYNWRKNFKLDDEDFSQNPKQEGNKEENPSTSLSEMKEEILNSSGELVDIRKFSLGGESITLFSQSPEKEKSEKDPEEVANMKRPKENNNEEVTGSMGLVGSPKEKVKKKKAKKKTRKEMKAQEELYSKDDEDSESQIFSRRSSSIQMDTDSPKRTSRSRRNSKASTEDSSHLFSPRSSVGIPEPFSGISEEYVEPSSVIKKKTKKRKKSSKNENTEHKTPTEMLFQETSSMEISEALTISCSLSNEYTDGYLLASISPQINKCLTPPSEEEDTAFFKEPDSKDDSNNSFDASVSDSFITKDSISRDESTSDLAVSSNKLTDQPIATDLTKEVSSSSLATTSPKPSSSSSTLETFDFLKDGNFYPLF